MYKRYSALAGLNNLYYTANYVAVVYMTLDYKNITAYYKIFRSRDEAQRNRGLIFENKRISSTGVAATFVYTQNI